MRNQIEPGQIIFVYGKASIYKHQIQLTNPKFITLDEENAHSPEDLSGGIYPATKDLSNRQIKRIIKPVLEKIDELV